MKCIILAGGSGDRLWPLSRKDYPKQFLSIHQENSLFQETITRNIPFCDEFIIVTNIEYRTIVEGQMNYFQGIEYRLILEEKGKGTAPALAAVARLLPDEEEIFILPADLYLEGDGYSDAVYAAKKLSQEKRIVLFGVRAEEPNESYGYIRYHGTEVTRYIEKPSKVFAEKIFADDNIFWNSGMILCQNSVFREELGKYAASLLEWAKDAVSEDTNHNVHGKHREIVLTTAVLERQHIEKVLLETSNCLSVVPLRCKWEDISNFSAYAKVVCLEEGQENSISYGCDNVTVINQASRHLVVANELKDILVVNTNDAVYISNQSSEQNIKGIITKQSAGYEEFFDNTSLVYRTWGMREMIAQDRGYRVRKVTMYPGTRIFSHSHANRTESYSVVKGTLTVEIESRIFRIHAGENVNILPMQQHELRNRTDENIILIEVDTGAEIDERDMLKAEETGGEQGAGQSLPSLYRLHPAYKDYLWGGERLVTLFGKDSPYKITAESWELSAHKDGQSRICGGAMDGMLFGDFINRYGTEVVGWKGNTFDRFPILIKFIDAKNPLSVQIHPYDDYAFVHENEFGKNEMWYVMDAEPGAFLYCGFKRRVNREEVEQRIAENTIVEVLNRVPVKAGDVVFIPAGTIHAIGAGILICEIQQSSNSTYRVYDYDRRDANGNLRELHITKALDVMNFDEYHQTAYGLEMPVEEVTLEGKITTQQLCLCKYFQCSRHRVVGKENLYLDGASFLSVVFLLGKAELSCEEERMEAKAGDSFFVPAGRKVLHIEGDCEFIVTNI